MKLEDLDLNKSYTYADYLTWQFDQIVELIRGKVFKMSPAPSRYHQEVSSNILRKVLYYFGGHPCKVYHAPFDVRLPLPPDKIRDDQIDTVVQPDISVICDQDKLDEKGCLGAPDWIIEILSPSTSHKDHKDKFDIYENAGVREYWIIDPVDKYLLVYTRSEDGKFIGQKPYVKEDSVTPSIFLSLCIDLDEVFPDVHMTEEERLEYQRTF
jgi:Uma2 family endonuclease